MQRNYTIVKKGNLLGLDKQTSFVTDAARLFPLRAAIFPSSPVNNFIRTWLKPKVDLFPP
jgi:hypothetical protein